jgi:hypothetical protein
MDIDDDAPPELVNTGVEKEAEEIAIKVPITIVTGTVVRSVKRRGTAGERTDGQHRVSWSGQDHTLELHSYSATWEEDCGYYERFVVRRGR